MGNSQGPYPQVPSDVKTGRMIAKDLGLKRCHRADALEIYNWMHHITHTVDLEELKDELYPQIPDKDAMNHVVKGLNR